MGRGHPMDPEHDDVLQMRPTPKPSYVDLQGEAAHEHPFTEQKPRIPV